MYINIQLNFYTVLSVNHILHLNYVFDELIRISIRLRIILYVLVCILCISLYTNYSLGWKDFSMGYGILDPKVKKNWPCR